MIITAGELLVEFVSHEIGCNLEKTTTYSGPYPSGAPAIFADQAARVGANAAMIGCVGDDQFGKILINRLNQDGVNTDHIHTNFEKTTGTAFVSYFLDGSRTFVFHLNGSAADNLTEVPKLEPGCTLHVSGASLANEQIRSASMDLVAQVRNIGKISYDPNIRPELLRDQSIRACVDQIIDASDYLLPSLDDITELFPELSPESFIEEMLNRGKSGVVVKQGEMGAIGSCGDELIRAEPVSVEAVDPTGAGDCFCGTFMGLLDQGYAFKEALETANVAGAMHVLQRGPMEWNPSLDEIKTFVEQRNYLL